MGFIIKDRVLEHYEPQAGVTEVVIPAGVTKIKDGAFSDCQNLVSVTIPDGVTYIGKFAFVNCTNLKSVNIPDSVTEIGFHAFKDCKSLIDITIPESVTEIGSGAFDSTPWLAKQSDDFVLAGKVLYKYNGNQTDVKIPIP